jgi:hypothetical protein
MKINGVNYGIPTIGFKAVKQLSQYGVSLFDLDFKRDFLSIISAFAGLATGLNSDDVDDLIEQHLLGGGTMEEWVDEILKAVENSPFLQSMNKKQKKAQSKTAVKEKATE